MRPASAHAHAPTKDHIQRSKHSFWILNELLEIETARFLFQQSLTNFSSNWEYIHIATIVPRRKKLFYFFRIWFVSTWNFLFDETCAHKNKLFIQWLKMDVSIIISWSISNECGSCSFTALSAHCVCEIESIPWKSTAYLWTCYAFKSTSAINVFIEHQKNGTA